MKNKLLVFEGIDGVGKSSLSHQIKEYLNTQGIAALCFEDEEKVDGFNQIKPFIKSKVAIEASLFFYLASAIYKSKLIDLLLQDSWVVCDRYVYSTIAYHLAKGVAPALIPDLSTVPIRKPDLFILLKAEEDVRISRLKLRTYSTPEDFLPKSPGSFYDQMEKSLESHQPIIINNSGQTPEETLAEIVTYLALPG